MIQDTHAFGMITILNSDIFYNNDVLYYGAPFWKSKEINIFLGYQTKGLHTVLFQFRFLSSLFMINSGPSVTIRNKFL